MNTDSFHALTPEQLQQCVDRSIYEPVEFLSSVSSTNAVIWEREWHPEPPRKSVLLASQQTAGRGRTGNIWVSPPGGLYLSILRRVTEGTARSSLFSLLAGLAVVRAMEGMLGLKASLKWPNDVLVEDRKIAGILCEGRGLWQVVGIGINVNVSTLMLGEPLQSSSASLMELLGRPVSMGELAGKLLAEFHRVETDYLSSGRFPLSDYLHYFPFRGQEVIMETTSGPARGVIRTVTPDGGLLVEHEDGSRICVRSGEVRHVRRP